MSLFARQLRAAFRAPVGLFALVTLACSVITSQSADVKPPLEPAVWPIAIPPAPHGPPSQHALEAAWLAPTDLPLNNVLAIVGVELALGADYHKSSLEREAASIFAVYENERALLAAPELKIEASGANNAERAEISAHNDRLTEYVTVLKQIPQLSARFQTAWDSATTAQREIADALANDYPYQATVNRLNGVRMDVFDSIHNVELAHNEFVLLSQRAAATRNAYRKGESTLGRKRFEILAQIEKNATDRATAVERLKVAVQTHKDELASWDTAQQKRSQELVEMATKRLKEFIASLPAVSKANENLKKATESLNDYLTPNPEGRKPTKRELNRRKKAVTTAQSNFEKTTQKTEALKAASEKAKADANAFVDAWTTEAKNRNAAVREESDKLKALQREQEAAPNLASVESSRLNQLLEQEVTPWENQADREQQWCADMLGDEYFKIIHTANSWLSGGVTASDAVARIGEARNDGREPKLARYIHSKLSEAANIEAAQAQIHSAPRFTDLKFEQKAENARTAWKALHDAQARARSLQANLATNRTVVISKLRRAVKVNAIADSQNSTADLAFQVDRLRALKQTVADAEFGAVRNALEYVMGSTGIDAQRTNHLIAARAAFEDEYARFQGNPLPLSPGLKARLEGWRNSSLVKRFRAPMSTDDDMAAPAGEVPNNIAVESWGNVKPEDWRASVGVWFKNLEEREDGIFLVEKQMARAFAYETRQAQREFLNGLMQRAFVRDSSAQVVRFANRLGVTVVRRNESGRAFSLTPFGSLKFLPRGTTFEKELLGDYQVERLIALIDLLTKRAAGFDDLEKTSGARTNFDGVLGAAEKARVDQLAKRLAANGNFFDLWRDALRSLNATDEKSRGQKIHAMFAWLQTALDPADSSESEVIDAVRKLAQQADAFKPAIIDAASPIFTTTTREYLTNRVAALDKLRALRSAIEANAAALDQLQQSLSKELQSLMPVHDTLEQTAASFLENWEAIWVAEAAKGLTAAWYLAEAFRPDLSNLANSYRSTLDRVNRALAIEQERAVALRQAWPVLSEPAPSVVVTR